MDNPNKPVENRRKDGTFGAGNNANPNGRPKGQTLKEYQAQKFRNMSDEEKDEFLETHKVSGETLWKMSEGNPKQDLEANVSISMGEILDELEDD